MFYVIVYKMMLKKFAWIISISVLSLFSSCSVSEIMNSENDVKESVYEDIMISQANLPLFADLENYSPNIKMRTRTSYGESVSLESLLDRSKTTATRFEHYYVKEIPFLRNSSPSFAVLSDDVLSSVSDLSLSEITLFLVEVTDTLKNSFDRKVVTLIPDKDYVERFDNSDYSYINKGVFSGVILFSDLDGHFRDVYIYSGDSKPILNAEIVDPSEMATCSRSCVLSLIGWTRTRTSGDEDEGEGNIVLEGSICIGFIEPDIKPDRLSTGYPGVTVPDNISDGNDMSGLSGGGGGSYSGLWTPTGSNQYDGGISNGTSILGNDGSIAGIPQEGLPFTPADEEIFQYIVSLSSGEGGMTSGSGSYSPGAFVICNALPSQGFILDRWVGDFKDKDETVYLTVNSDVSSTAYYKRLLYEGSLRPCLDTLSGIMNPLVSMALAPSNTWDKNMKGATFGKTRIYENQIRTHNGLDLLADVGTPIYAMADGVVSDFHYCKEQPDMISKTDYPVRYRGDTNKAGNRIHIKSVINGTEVLIGFWHLYAKNPIAINPRTGLPFAPGDIVYQGEIIAYTGKTGNCFGIPFYHLHLAVIDFKKIHQSNKYIDPQYYINGAVDWEGDMKVYNGRIINIKCHEE